MDLKTVIYILVILAVGYVFGIKYPSFGAGVLAKVGL